RQWRAIRIQAEIAEKTLQHIDRQANIADKTLILANRPKIKIRSVTVNDDVFSSGQGKISVQYEAVNYGQTDAILVTSNHCVWLKGVNERLPMSPPYDIPPYPITKPGRVFEAGESYQFSIDHYVSESQEMDFLIGS